MGLCCSLSLVPSTQRHKQKLLIVASGQLVTKGLSKSSRVAGTPFPATWHHVGNTMLAMHSCSNLHPTPTGKPGPGGTGAVHSTLNKTLPVNSSLPLMGGWDALLAPFSLAVARPVSMRNWRHGAGPVIGFLVMNYLTLRRAHCRDRGCGPLAGWRVREQLVRIHSLLPPCGSGDLSPAGRCSCLLSRLTGPLPYVLSQDSLFIQLDWLASELPSSGCARIINDYAIQVRNHASPWKLCRGKSFVVHIQLWLMLTEEPAMNRV